MLLLPINTPLKCLTGMVAEESSRLKLSRGAYVAQALAVSSCRSLMTKEALKTGIESLVAGKGLASWPLLEFEMGRMRLAVLGEAASVDVLEPSLHLASQFISQFPIDASRLFKWVYDTESLQRQILRLDPQLVRLSFEPGCTAQGLQACFISSLACVHLDRAKHQSSNRMLGCGI